jgi:hypothetical protein
MCKYFNVEQVPVSNIQQLSKLLIDLEDAQDQFIIRGQADAKTDLERSVRRKGFIGERSKNFHEISPYSDSKCLNSNS